MLILIIFNFIKTTMNPSHLLLNNFEIESGRKRETGKKEMLNCLQRINELHNMNKHESRMLLWSRFRQNIEIKKLSFCIMIHKSNGSMEPFLRIDLVHEERLFT